MGLNFFKIIQKIESAFMFILLHGGLETIILFVFGEELYNKYKIINGKKYKRLWSADKNAWIDPYWTLA